jgi:riboflavin kinase/FMN adenylyltransferase
MPHHRSLEQISLPACWLTIGVFDGVHRGHREIMARLISGAHASGLPAVALTFDPHPARVLGGRDLKSLTTPEERADLLAFLGVDEVITHPFDREVASLSAQDFIERVHAALGFRHLLTGYDFALGRGREGNNLRLAEIGQALGYSVEVVEAVGDESGVISSSAIRKLISVGDVTEAGKLLGHNYSLRGPVVHGDGRGRKINIPTANIGLPPEKMIPANGVYACRVRTTDGLHLAVTNVGVRPTFLPEGQSANVETHILDFGRELYGEEIELEFIARLRDEMKFPSVDALIEQIQSDIDQARALTA